MKTIFLDDQYLKVSPQIIEAFTPGVFKAKGVFETMLGLDGALLDTALHLKRLRSGLKILGIKVPSINPLVLKEVLHRNHLSRARVRLMVWQVPPVAGQVPPVAGHVMAAALPYKVSTKRIYRVCLIKTNRSANDRLADLKSLDYELFARAKTEARSKGFDEALLLNRSGAIFEASRANIFWIKDKVLYTPPLSSGCLNGITRQQVIKYAKNLKISVKERNLTPEILKKADAAFLTNSLIGIKPISLIN
jgi:branched-subunit amino acid aminotransferase/4-amino-4-deoxychorismate lyase